MAKIVLYVIFCFMMQIYTKDFRKTGVLNIKYVKIINRLFFLYY